MAKKPTMQAATFLLYQGSSNWAVTFLFDQRGRHDLITITDGGETKIRVNNIGGDYKPRVTDCFKLIEQAAKGDAAKFDDRRSRAILAAREAAAGRRLRVVAADGER